MSQSRTFKKILFILIDAIIVVLSGVLTTWLITGTTDLEVYKKVLLIYFPLEIVFVIWIFKLLKLYRSLWRYAGIVEFFNIVVAVISVTAVNFTIVICCKIFLSDIALKYDFSLLPIRFPIINGLIMVSIVVITRFSYRLMRHLLHKNRLSPKDHSVIRVMIIGAGDAGCTIIKELQNSKMVNKTAVCVIDDDSSKLNTFIEGVPVVGNRNQIIEMVEEYDIKEIIIAIPSLNAKTKADILNICKETKCKVKIIPGIYEFVNGTASIAKARDVEIVDLLGREQIKVNLDEIMGYIEKRIVLVTGGGGSIGSELCRQIASHNPKQLIIVDIYENNAYDIEQELKRKFPNLNLLVLIASIRDKNKVCDIFKKYHPEIVFNAAAHKHVPLMETSPNEAIKNNVFGTLNVAKAANEYGAKRFVQNIYG